MNLFFKPEEVQSPELREQTLMSGLSDFLSHSRRSCEYYQNTLAGIDLSKVDNRAALAALPITRKSDLIELQRINMPFAGIVPAAKRPDRVFQSPGPIYEPEFDKQDWWRLGQAFYAAGFRAGDVVQNCLSYHLTPGGFIMDSGARACGCSVIPAGPGQGELQLEMIENLRPNGYCGTPSFLHILLEKAQHYRKDISSITKALVTGEALSAQLRAIFEQADIQVKQAYATADIGLIAYESVVDEGLVVAEDIILEIVRPGSLEPVSRGEVGEVVITRLDRGYPLIRFATGDLSAELLGQSPCGRTNMRIKGWLGRADQTTKVKGLFIHPEQVERIRLAHAGIAKVRLVVSKDDHKDSMCLMCEITDASAGLDEQAVQENIRAITQLSGTVKFVTAGSLPDDGLVIDDQR